MLRAKIDAGIARIIIERPTLNESLLRRLIETFDEVLGDDHVSAILLCGEKEHFLLGADLPFFVRSIAAGNLERVLGFTRDAHQLLERIAASTKPITAWVEGAAMGAGLEIALACHRIIASPGARFALPETSLGIYPGMGGTQRTPRRIGTGLAKWLIYTGATVRAQQAAEIGLVDDIQAGSPVWLEANSERNDPCLGERFQALDHLFRNSTVDQLLDPQLPTDSPSLARAVIDVCQNAPLAVRLAESIINSGVDLPLRDAIEVEYRGLRQVFATDDAMTGMLSFGKSRPSFRGA